MLYHQISGQEASNNKQYLNSIPLSKFAEQMKYLKQSGYITLSLAEAADYLENGKIPEKAICITFDDGYRDNYERAFPILLDNGFKANIFLIADYIDKGKWYSREKRIWSDDNKGEDFQYYELLTRSQIEEMSRYGISFEAHSITHPDLTSLPLSSARMEINESKKMIEDLIGETVKFFAYPYGKYNEMLRDQLIKSGYKGACIIGGRAQANGKGSDLYALERIGIVPQYDIDSFKVMITGYYEKYRWFTRGIGNG